MTMKTGISNCGRAAGGRALSVALAAQVFADYVMSRDGQTVWHSRGETASPLTGITGSLQAASISAWDTDAYPADVVKKYTEYWNRMFR